MQNAVFNVDKGDNISFEIRNMDILHFFYTVKKESKIFK